MFETADRWAAALSAVALLALVGCPTGTGSLPETCGEASCDPATEFCVFQGSDVAGEPNTAQCAAVPDACVGDNTCTCLEEDEQTLDAYRFCFESGGCSEADGVPEIVCPGG